MARTTKKAALDRIRMCRENLRGMEDALRTGDADAFDDWYGQLMGDAEIASRVFHPEYDDQD